jgi:urate oxidase
VSAVLSHDTYGKSRIRLTKVTRRAERHDVRELVIDIALQGEFESSYLKGDNRLVIPTDTMKNVAFALAREHSLESIEAFGSAIADHFLDHNAHVAGAVVRIEEQPLERVCIDGRDHPHAFAGTTSERRTSAVSRSRAGRRIESGLGELFLLKSTGSAFCGFLTDRYTTLKDAPDRILATMLKAEWLYLPVAADWNELHAKIRRRLIVTFANHNSLSVQQTLYAMGEAALDGFPEIEKITLTMPNKHRILANLEPFGLDNANEVFVATEEPYGTISGTLSRAPSPPS